jgi:DNA-binding transcriptional ArsR family regulator
MGAAGTKAKKTAKKPSSDPRSGGTPDTRLSNVLDLFEHLSDPVCLRVLALADEMSSVAEIGKAGALDPSAIRDHLAKLRKDGLVAVRPQGKQELCSLTDRGQRVLGLVRWLVYLEQPQEKPPITTPIDPALLKDLGGLVEDPEVWFRTPNVVFEGRSPIELLGTPDEARLRNRILAAKLGMFS